MGVLVSLLIFAIMRIAPGDVAPMIAMADGEEVEFTEQQIEDIREQMGLNKPLPVQYLVWMKDMVTLDWGTSLFNDRSIWDEFKRKVPVTFELVIMTVTLATIIGIPVGVIMALKQGHLDGLRSEDFLPGRAVHAKGLRYFLVVTWHAMLPVVTIIGVSVAVTMGGSVIMERIFNLQGMGNFLVEGMNNLGYPVVQTLILVFALWVVLGQPHSRPQLRLAGSADTM